MGNIEFVDWHEYEKVWKLFDKLPVYKCRICWYMKPIYDRKKTEREQLRHKLPKGYSSWYNNFATRYLVCTGNDSPRWDERFYFEFLDLFNYVLWDWDDESNKIWEKLKKL